MKKLVISLFALMLVASGPFASGPAFAADDEAPPPNKAPRTPVHRQALAEKEAVQEREVAGPAIVIDAEHVRIGDLELKLFGIVPPQLSASYGPQARAALDQTVAGKTIDCQVHDRDHDGRLLAICKADGTDLGLALLQRGLAVTARSSLVNTEYAQAYIAAEQAASAQKLGLWSSAPPPPPAPVVVAMAPAPVTPKVEYTPPPAPVVAAAPAPIKLEKLPPKYEEQRKEIVAALPVAALASTAAKPSLAANVAAQAPGFIAQYQILIACFLMLFTAFGILLAINIGRSRERREEICALAAALRGELMAARAVCQARLRMILTEADDRNITWPRIRATLYQAYVGRLGSLGAELARQIASIYGQTSDYSAYYASAEDHATMPKRQALETLMQHIEAVLPRLGGIEETGLPPRTGLSFAAPSPVVTVAHTAPQQRIQAPQTRTMPTPVASMTAAPAEAAPPPSAHVRVPTEAPVTAETVETEILAEAEIPEVAPMPEPAPTPAPAAMASASNVPGNDRHYNRAASPIPLWKAMRNFTREKFAAEAERNRQARDPMEDQMPDYATMLDEELADMSFSDGEGDDDLPSNETKFGRN